MALDEDDCKGEFAVLSEIEGILACTCRKWCKHQSGKYAGILVPLEVKWGNKTEIYTSLPICKLYSRYEKQTQEYVKSFKELNPEFDE